MEIFTHWVTTQIPAMARPGLDQRWSLELSLSLLGARDLKDLSRRLLFPRLSISRKLELGMNSDPLWLLDACCVSSPSFLQEAGTRAGRVGQQMGRLPGSLHLVAEALSASSGS